ncbi:MAG: hypothetical protein V4596_03200 [Bdellovibrionota bacterium]
MFKTLLITALTFIATTSIARTPPIYTCSCTQTFEDFMENESEVTVHVTCPTAPKELLTCNSQITKKTFSTICTNTETEESNVTKINNEPGTKPTFGFAGCYLN